MRKTYRAELWGVSYNHSMFMYPLEQYVLKFNLSICIGYAILCSALLFLYGNDDGECHKYIRFYWETLGLFNEQGFPQQLYTGRSCIHVNEFIVGLASYCLPLTIRKNTRIHVAYPWPGVFSVSTSV